jgi:D-alanine-D-alanine ligase-like ATP-grasp enzyme
MAATQAIKEYLEGLQLVITPHESWRTGTSIGRIRVVVRAHGQKIINLIRLYRDSINPEKLCKTMSIERNDLQ